MRRVLGEVPVTVEKEAQQRVHNLMPKLSLNCGSET